MPTASHDGIINYLAVLRGNSNVGQPVKVSRRKVQKLSCRIQMESHSLSSDAPQQTTLPPHLFTQHYAAMHVISSTSGTPLLWLHVLTSMTCSKISNTQSCVITTTLTLKKDKLLEPNFIKTLNSLKNWCGSLMPNLQLFSKSQEIFMVKSGFL